MSILPAISSRRRRSFSLISWIDWARLSSADAAVAAAAGFIESESAWASCDDDAAMDG